jgi:hypothetical protein
MIEDFTERLRINTGNMIDEDYTSRVSQLYYLEEAWSHLIPDNYLTAKMKEQQCCIWEFLTTERNYICRMRLVVEVNLFSKVS